MSVGRLRIKLVRSAIGRDQTQKDTVRALGLSKLHQSVEHNATPQVLGMIRKVRYMLDVEEVS